MAKTAIDENTRVIFFDQLTVKLRPGGKTPDFARDHVVILGPDQKVMGEYWPLERGPAARPAAPDTAAAVHRGAAGPAAGGPAAGPLTDSQRETLERLWAANPSATLDRIGDLFERQCGRSVSAVTVLKYKPGK